MNIKIPKSGQMVYLRNRPGLVREVNDSIDSVSKQVIYAVTVDYIDGLGNPESESVIWNLEHNTIVYDSLGIPKLDGNSKIIRPELFNAYINAYKWTAINKFENLAGNNNKVDFIAPWYGAIQVEDYQLYPLLKALAMPRVSMFLADDVGLGKTIEAALIASEFLARRIIQNILVICPASLQKQWKDEFEEKFKIDFEIVDRNKTFQLQSELGIDTNPWNVYPHIITSMDYIRQPDVIQQFESAAQSMVSSKSGILPWDFLIVDEAHNFAPQRFSEDSQRIQMLRKISSYFEHKIFLSATPHNGYTWSFTGLLEILDPVRFHQWTEIDDLMKKHIKEVVVRRLKSELPKKNNIERFSKREVKVAIIDKLTDKENNLFNALREYREYAIKYIKEYGYKERGIAQFVFTILTKRLLSSIYSFANTWWNHIGGLTIDFDENEINNTVNKVINRAETDINDDIEMNNRVQDAVKETGGWLKKYSEKLLPYIENVSQCLNDLGWHQESVNSDIFTIKKFPKDSSFETLLKKVISLLLDNNGQLKNNERIIIFTEYKHTLDYLFRRLQIEGFDSPVLEIMYGGMDDTKRELIKYSFNDSESPLRILIATDTASEGINLQSNCRYVMHYEVPWNPMRMEQRNGRVDRHGQSRDVNIFHFTSTENEELQFMSKIVKKVEQVRDDLGSVGKVIDTSIIDYFSTGNTDYTMFENEISRITNSSQQKLDIQDSDKGGKKDYTEAYNKFIETQRILGIDSKNLSEFLIETFRLPEVNGDLTQVDEQVFKIEKEPIDWKQLIDDKLKIKKGVLGKAAPLPKLVFDPLYFETVENNRPVFKYRNDTALIRLGHPLMQRAIKVMKKQTWNENDFKRWTISAASLPDAEWFGIMYLSIEADNCLKELFHQELLALPFVFNDDAIKNYSSEKLKDILQNKRNLSKDEFEKTNKYVDVWKDSLELFTDKIENVKKEYTVKLESLMKELLEKEMQYFKNTFDDRINEIRNLKGTRWQTRIEKEIEKQKEKLKQQFLFSNMQYEEEQKLKDLEAQVETDKFEVLENIVSREMQRTIEKVLPNRFKLNSFTIYPLGVEFILNFKK